MTIRGHFFTKEDFMHLVFSAFAQTGQRLRFPKPAFIKPARLWSGKQVFDFSFLSLFILKIITTIIQNCCPPDLPLINLHGRAKTGAGCWKVRDPISGKELPTLCQDMSESEVIFRCANKFLYFQIIHFIQTNQ